MSCIVLVLTLLLAWPVASWAQPAQLINGNRTHAGATNYGVTTGTGSAYILTLNAAIPGYVNGSCYLMQAHVANTGPATLNVNNRGAQALKKKVGTAQVDLAANDIIAGQQVKACTDGTVMQTDLGSGTGGGASDFSELTGTASDAQIPHLNTLSTGLTPSRCVETNPTTGQLTVAAGPCGAAAGFVDVSGTPTAGQLAMFVDPNTVQGSSTLDINYAASHVSTSGTISTGTEYVTTGAGTVTRTLPAAASGTSTKRFYVIKEDAGAGTVSIPPAGGNTISFAGGTGTLTITQQWTGWVLHEVSATGWYAEPIGGGSGSGIDLTTTPMTGTLAEFNAALEGADFVSLAGAEDVSGKRIAPRYIELSAASGTVTAPNPAVAGGDIYYRYGVTGPLTIPVPTPGTPVNGQRLLFILQADSPQALVFTTGPGGFSGDANQALPTTTTGDVGGNNVYDHYTFIYNSHANRFVYAGGSRATSPCAVSAGCTGLSSGTSGGIPYFSSASTMASSALLAANAPVLGGGAGAAPVTGTRSGTTTEFGTIGGTKTVNKQLAFDASGNVIASATDIGAGGGGGFGVRSLQIDAGSMDVSGGCFVNGPAVLVTNGPKRMSVGCTDADADSIEFDFVMPDGWDAGTLTMQLVAFSVGNNNGEVFEMDFAFQCVSSGDTPTAHSTTGEQAATITWGNTATREQHATTAAITGQGTCTAGDHVYARGQVDATATTMTPMTDLKILGVKVEWTRSAHDQ